MLPSQKIGGYALKVEEKCFWRINMGIVEEEEKIITGIKNTVEYCEN